MRFIIIHGTYGNAAENWFPWLQKELKDRGHEVVIPTFSTPDNQTLDTWLDEFKLIKDEVDENTIMIGHSLGSAFILRILERIRTKIRASILVAPFINKLGIEYDQLNESFIGEFKWENILKRSKEFHVIISGNDPYVPLEEGKIVAENLKINPMIIEDAGHFNSATGYDKFHVLLEQIEGIIQETQGQEDSTLPQ